MQISVKKKLFLGHEENRIKGEAFVTQIKEVIP